MQHQEEKAVEIEMTDFSARKVPEGVIRLPQQARPLRMPYLPVPPGAGLALRCGLFAYYYQQQAQRRREAMQEAGPPVLKR